MITGTIMLDIGVNVRSEAALNDLSEQIRNLAKTVDGVTSAEEVDTDVSGGDEDEGPADPAE